MLGYGHITPTTTSGKLQLVAYIIVGLPLMMVFLSNIGNSMASGLKLFYSRIGCRWCRIRRKKSELEAAHGLLAPPAITRRNDVDRPTQPGNYEHNKLILTKWKKYMINFASFCKLFQT